MKAEKAETKSRYNGYVELAINVVLTIAEGLFDYDSPQSREYYKKSRQATLSGRNDIYFTVSGLDDFKDFVLDVYNRCETLQKSRKYMQDKYGFVPDIERGENIKYIFENIKAKSQKDIAQDLGLYASQVSKIITKYGGEKYGRT